MALNTAKKQKDSKRRDIEQGLMESQPMPVDQMTDEELDLWHWKSEYFRFQLDEAEYLRKIEEESPLVLEEGLKKVDEILALAKGELVGAVNKRRFYDYHTTELFLSENMFGRTIEKNDILNMLAQKKPQFSPHFDTSLVWAGRNSGDGSRWNLFLGKEFIATKIDSRHGGADLTYYIFDKPVSREVLEIFEQEVELKVRLFEASLTSEEVELISKKKLDFEIDLAFSRAKSVRPGICGFNHLYGGQSFGSGGAHGRVKAYDLEAFGKGEKIEKEITMLRGENQFVSGVYAVEIEENTIVIAEGGDSIGDGREWTEVFVCE